MPNLSQAVEKRRKSGPSRAAAQPLAPAKSADPALRRTDSAHTAFVAIAGTALAQINDNALVLRQTRRLEAVHQLRVGVRRLRSAISLFGPLLEGPQTEAVIGELKWLNGELADARDMDVYIADTFRPAAKRHPDWIGLAAFGKSLLAAQSRAYDRAQTAVCSSRFGALMHEAALWVEAGEWTANGDSKVKRWRAWTIGTLADTLLEERRRKLIKRGRKFESLDAAARHKLRIHAKKLRYACGFFASLHSGKAGKRRVAFVTAMHDLQDALGRLTDIAGAGDTAAGIAGVHVGAEAANPSSLDLRRAYAAGLVAAERIVGQDMALEAAKKSLRRFKRAERFW